MNSRWPLLTLAVLVLACGESTDTAPTTAGVPALAESYWVATPTAEALTVFQAKEQAGSGATVHVVGRVSGYVENRASFKVTDMSFVHCADRPGDTCETPWDYCCEAPDELARGTLTVEVREGAQLAKVDLKSFHGFDYLSQVVVNGVAEKDDAGNVIVVAEGIHVTP